MVNCCCSAGKCGCCGDTKSCSEWFRKKRGCHVALISIMWILGFIIAALMGVMWRGGPVIWTIMGVIGALACMLFSGGGACMGCVCANDIAREDDGGGGKVADGGAPPVAEVDLEAAEPAEEPAAADLEQ